MGVVEVITGNHKKEFNDFQRDLYRGKKFWISPLDSETEAVFDPKKMQHLVREKLSDG